MIRATLIISALTMLITSGTIAANDWLRSVPDFELEDQNGNPHSLASYRNRDFIVFYVQGVGCPIARIATPSYREARAEFSDQNVEFLMFNSNIQDNPARIAKEAEEFKIDFPILKDTDQELAKALGVERTAEVFIINPKTKDVLYRGPINDQLGYETQRNHANSHFLKDSLNTVLQGGIVNIEDIPDSKGCLVAIF
ncbi:MAG: redoxin domain-containing protein [Gammaproteobacteria bacterium]|nr:redoxin domain-containing protein [Gammaproteobacteria bacterium]MDG1951841.1 redoxin domain-containing protein [Gammaproteobacteria bacterium]MDG2118066.1 redoxin domain-containing protein [Gammaproteobacteria bacterium]|tara:strand:+ start:4098 stop:4688 length:591 start_codon:yes stop_codon:yes gene_type:complete